MGHERLARDRRGTHRGNSAHSAPGHSEPPLEAALLGLQRSAGNGAVDALLHAAVQRQEEEWEEPYEGGWTEGGGDIGESPEPSVEAEGGLGEEVTPPEGYVEGQGEAAGAAVGEEGPGYGPPTFPLFPRWSTMVNAPLMQAMAGSLSQPPDFRIASGNLQVASAGASAVQAMLGARGSGVVDQAGGIAAGAQSDFDTVLRRVTEFGDDRIRSDTVSLTHRALLTGQMLAVEDPPS
jgi:hypothetical protein